MADCKQMFSFNDIMLLLVFMADSKQMFSLNDTMHQLTGLEVITYAITASYCTGDNSWCRDLPLHVIHHPPLLYDSQYYTGYGTGNLFLTNSSKHMQMSCVTTGSSTLAKHQRLCII
jgi:hypothetical protein